jgi:hypothetical protein
MKAMDPEVWAAMSQAERKAEMRSFIEAITQDEPDESVVNKLMEVSTIIEDPSYQCGDAEDDTGAGEEMSDKIYEVNGEMLDYEAFSQAALEAAEAEGMMDRGPEYGRRLEDYFKANGSEALKKFMGTIHDERVEPKPEILFEMADLGKVFDREYILEWAENALI